MNIMFLNSIETDTYGGMEEWIRLVATGMRQRGHCVAVAGRTGAEFLRRVHVLDADLEMLPLHISGDFNPTTISAIRRALAERETGLLVTNFNKDLRLGGLAARWYGKTRIVWSLGIDLTKNSPFHRWLTPKLTDAVIVPSESLRSQIKRHGYLDDRAIKVIPIGIPDTAPVIDKDSLRSHVRAKYSFPKTARIAVTSGRFVEQKGHRYLLEAMAILKERAADLRFLWLGSGPLEKSLRQHADHLGVTSKIVFAGMLDSVERELAGADFMIHPSVEEPFGIAVLEGMRAGLPIIASRVGGIPEVVDEQCALLVPARNPNAIADAILAVASDVERCRRMSEDARNRFVKYFQVDRMCDQVEECFARLVKGEHSE